jgi:signal transduction histidine kinase
VVSNSKGPAAAIPHGTVLAAIENDHDRVELTPFDLTTEPDGAMGDYATYRRFLERQTRLARIQASPEVTFHAADGSRFVVSPVADGRPPGDFPVDFWVQCVVGLVAWLVSAAVFAFRPWVPGARYLLLSGASTLLFAPAAAVYTTRELAVDGGLLRWASDLNFLGGSLFAASFVGLLLVYPRRIAPRWTGPAVVAAYLGWFFMQQAGVFESMTFARRFLVMVGVVATFVLAAIHWRCSGRDPLARAALQWFLLSWVVGTSLFALFILLPQTFGVDTSPIQGYAFLLFLLVYGGLAFGILRYRLFELGDLWRQGITWTVAALVLVALDLLFLYGLHFSLGVSLALALMVCGLVWLPLRGWLWQRLAGRRASRMKDLFGRVMSIALSPADGGHQSRGWRDLLESVFQPIEIVPGDAEEVAILDDGLSMELPAVGNIGGLRLGYPRGGHGLFGPGDAALAGELVSMLNHGIESLASYRKGATEERCRIARDMHDNIGAQLLSALHSREMATKDAKIRETLADLRGIINNAPGSMSSINEILAELRVETADRLDAAGMRLEWKPLARDQPGLARDTVHALRSIIREAVSNTIRHSNARVVTIGLDIVDAEFRLVIADDGGDFDHTKPSTGNGLANIHERVLLLGGVSNVDSTDRGCRLSIRLPVSNHSGQYEKMPDR